MSIENFLSCLTWAQKWVNIGRMFTRRSRRGLRRPDALSASLSASRFYTRRLASIGLNFRRFIRLTFNRLLVCLMSRIYTRCLSRLRRLKRSQKSSSINTANILEGVLDDLDVLTSEKNLIMMGLIWYQISKLLPRNGQIWDKNHPWLANIPSHFSFAF